MTASTQLGQAVERAVKAVPERPIHFVRLAHKQAAQSLLITLTRDGHGNGQTLEFEIIRLACEIGNAPIQERRPLLDKLAGLALRMSAEAPSM